jgi:hypothetical protein
VDYLARPRRIARGDLPERLDEGKVCLARVAVLRKSPLSGSVTSSSTAVRSSLTGTIAPDTEFDDSLPLLDHRPDPIRTSTCCGPIPAYADPQKQAKQWPRSIEI